MVLVVHQAVRCIRSMASRPDHLRKQVGIVVHVMRHLTAYVEKDLKEFWPPVHPLIVNGESTKDARPPGLQISDFGSGVMRSPM